MTGSPIDTVITIIDDDGKTLIVLLPSSMEMTKLMVFDFLKVLLYSSYCPSLMEVKVTTHSWMCVYKRSYLELAQDLTPLKLISY